MRDRDPRKNSERGRGRGGRESDGNRGCRRKGKVGPETKAASERASERTNRGSHGRKGCVIRVPDEGTSGERSNEPTNKRTVTCAEGCRLGDSAYRTTFRCDTFSTNYVGRVGKKKYDKEKHEGDGDARFPKLRRCVFLVLPRVRAYETRTRSTSFPTGG